MDSSRRPPIRPSKNQSVAPTEEEKQYRPQQEDHVSRTAPQAIPDRVPWLMEKRRIRFGHVVIVVAMMCVFAVGMAVSTARVRALSAELEETKGLVRETREEVEEKERVLQFTKTDEYIEQQARDRFGYIYPDEIRFLPDSSLTNEFGTYAY